MQMKMQKMLKASFSLWRKKKLLRGHWNDWRLMCFLWPHLGQQLTAAVPLKVSPYGVYENHFKGHSCTHAITLLTKSQGFQWTRWKEVLMCVLTGGEMKTGESWMESGTESTVCALLVVVDVVKWVFIVLEKWKVSQQGQQFISQQGGGQTNSVKRLIFPNNPLLSHFIPLT